MSGGILQSSASVAIKFIVHWPGHLCSGIDGLLKSGVNIFDIKEVPTADSSSERGLPIAENLSANMITESPILIFRVLDLAVWRNQTIRSVAPNARL